MMVKTLLHSIAHWIGWNTGIIETWWRDDGVLMVGFRCECGRLEGVECTKIRKKGDINDAKGNE